MTWDRQDHPAALFNFAAEISAAILALLLAIRAASAGPERALRRRRLASHRTATSQSPQ
jgi:hypothetical protein